MLLFIIFCFVLKPVKCVAAFESLAPNLGTGTKSEIFKNSLAKKVLFLLVDLLKF